MELNRRLFYSFLSSSLFGLFLWGTPAFSAATKTVIADGRYVMADGDTLAGAEEKGLQRAQRSAVEEAGVYLESTFHDGEEEHKPVRWKSERLLPLLRNLKFLNPDAPSSWTAQSFSCAFEPRSI